MEQKAPGEQPRDDKPRLCFRNLEETDLNLLVHWMKLPHVAQWWGPESLMTDIDLKQKYLDYLNLKTVHPFIITLGHQPIGYIQFYGATKADNNGWQEPEGSYGVDLFIGETDLLGKGYGTLIVKNFIDFLFTEHHATMIIIDPDPENIRAIRCYEKVGFTPIGLRETIEGIHLLMELTRGEWERLQKAG